MFMKSSDCIFAINMLKCAVVLTSVLAVALASVARAPLESIPEKFKEQSGCYVSALDRMIPLGQTDSRVPTSDSDECIGYTCQENNILVLGCSPSVAEPPCKLVEERDKPYPDCCKRYECP